MPAPLTPQQPSSTRGEYDVVLGAGGLYLHSQPFVGCSAHALGPGRHVLEKLV